MLKLNKTVKYIPYPRQNRVWLEYCVVVDFISMGLIELWGTQSKRELRNEKLLSTVGFEVTTFRTGVVNTNHCGTGDLLVHYV